MVTHNLYIDFRAEEEEEDCCEYYSLTEQKVR